MQPLTTAFVGGSVFDGCSDRTARTAVGVAGDRIVALGEDEVAQWTTARTRVVDLRGRLLLPGLVDAHVHPVEGGSERLGCDLSPGHTRAEYLDLVRAYVRDHPRSEWIIGGGWAQAAFPGGAPRADDLDAVCADRPVVISNRDHHSAWVNSRALQLAGITARTADPPDGRIERDADGNPTGTLHEGARMLALRLAPAQTEDEMHAGLLEAQRYLHGFGITGWQDALIGDYGNHSSRFAGVYQKACENAELTARVNGALWWDRERGLEQLAGLIETRAAHQQENFRITTVKIMQDGVTENRTAAVLTPYLSAACGCAGGGTGISFVDPELLKGYVTELDREGFQAHFHAIGERAVREALDAVQAARGRNPLPGPAHHIAHLQLVHPDDVPRFAELRVAANIQALWAAYDPQMVELNLPILGQERAHWQYPFASLRDAGAQVCAGSDWPVTSPDPWLGMHVAVNRQLPVGDPGHHPEMFLPEQRLTLAQALRAYTSGAARINGREHYTGQIRRGYVADLAVVDRDPFRCPPDEIHLTRTQETFFAGESVYRAEET